MRTALRLGKVPLQPRNVCRGPIADVGHVDPGVDVIGRGVDMAVADRCVGCGEHVQRKLEKCDDRVPAHLRRHVGAARRRHPVRRAIEAAMVEKRRRVAGILEIDEPDRAPRGAWT